MAIQRKTFHFSILPTTNAWTWRTLDSDGLTLDSGLAPSRKIAAACVIRALARQEAAQLPGAMRTPREAAAPLPAKAA